MCALIRMKKQYQGKNLTLLVELKSSDNAGLITCKEKSSTFYCLFRFRWWIHLWSKLNPASHDSFIISIQNVVSRVSFPDVRSKWTFKLGVFSLLEFEVIASVKQMSLSMFVQRELERRVLLTLLNPRRLSRGSGL